MAQGTFNKIGSGTTIEDAIRPDFSGLAEVVAGTHRARFRKLISETPTQITCEYDLVAKTQSEKNDDRIRAAAIDNIIAVLEAGTATSAQVQNILAKVLKYLRARHTDSEEAI